MKLELIGRKGRDFFRKRGAAIAGEHIQLAAKVKYADTAAIAQKAMEMYRAEEIDAVYLLYNEFKSVVSQKLTVTRVLPGPEAAPAQPERRRPITFSSSRRPKCWTRCCPGTWKWSFIARCWNRRPPSTPRA